MDFDIPYLIKDADYPVGGAAVEWLNWVKGFQQNDDDIGVLTWKGVHDYLGTKANGYHTVETFGEDEGVRYLRTFNLRLPRFMQAIQAYRPSAVIQGCAALNTGLLCMAAHALSVPFVYRAANDMDADDRYKQRMSSYEAFFYRYGLRKADAIVCQNDYQYRKFKEQFPDKPITILHNPYEGKTEGELVPPDQRKYIAWLGVFQPQKNMPALYELAKALPQYQFRIGGKVTKSRMDEATHQALQNLEVAPNVTFEGYIKRTAIPDFLSKAHLLLNTSHYEGFSNTFLEAFAAGTPIVTTRKVDPDHIIENSRLGFVADDYLELSGGIEGIINHENYGDLSQRCRDYVIHHHNPAQLAARFTDFLAKLPRRRT